MKRGEFWIKSALELSSPIQLTISKRGLFHDAWKLTGKVALIRETAEIGNFYKLVTTMAKEVARLVHAKVPDISSCRHVEYLFEFPFKSTERKPYFSGKIGLLGICLILCLPKYRGNRRNSHNQQGDQPLFHVWNNERGQEMFTTHAPCTAVTMILTPLSLLWSLVGRTRQKRFCGNTTNH